LEVHEIRGMEREKRTKISPRENLGRGRAKGLVLKRLRSLYMPPCQPKNMRWKRGRVPRGKETVLEEINFRKSRRRSAGMRSARRRAGEKLAPIDHGKKWAQSSTPHQRTRKKRSKCWVTKRIRFVNFEVD